MSQQAHSGSDLSADALAFGLPDDLVDDMRGLARGNVSAFVTTAIRHEVDRRQLFCFLDEMDQELGPVDEEEVGY